MRVSHLGTKFPCVRGITRDLKPDFRSTNLGGLWIEWRVHQSPTDAMRICCGSWNLVYHHVLHGLPAILGYPFFRFWANKKWHSVVASPLICSCFLPISSFSPRDTTSTNHPNMCICATMSLGLIWLWVKIEYPKIEWFKASCSQLLNCQSDGKSSNMRQNKHVFLISKQELSSPSTFTIHWYCVNPSSNPSSFPFIPIICWRFDFPFWLLDSIQIPVLHRFIYYQKSQCLLPSCPMT